MSGPTSRTFAFYPEEHPLHFANSGFFQGELLSGLVHTQFSYKIHSIFSRDKFPESEFDYANIEDSLRLTSALLTAAIPIFHSILVEGPSPSKTAIADGVPLWLFPEPVEGLKQEEVQATWALIERMGNKLTFRMDASDKTAGAFCRRLDDDDYSLGPDLRGCGSMKCVSGGLYNLVDQSYDDPTDIIDQQASALHFAATLIHELTHAAVNAATPVSHANARVAYFLGNAQTTEIGYEAEAWLFGNVSICQPFWGYRAFYNKDLEKYSGLARLLTVTEYPCPSKKLLYDQHADEMFVRGRQSSAEIVWNVPFLKIHSLFQDEFWQKFFPVYGRRALFFEKNTGYRFVPRGDDRELKPMPLTSFPDDVPPEYCIDSMGLIRRRQDGRREGKWNLTCQPKTELGVEQPPAIDITDLDWRLKHSSKPLDSRRGRLLTVVRECFLFRAFDKR